MAPPCLAGWFLVGGGQGAIRTEYGVGDGIIHRVRLSGA